jgi:membrane-associated phospholipid phosphatase
MSPWDIISSSTVLFYITPIILFIINKQKKNIIVLSGLIGTLLSSEFIKRFIIDKKSTRPNGAKDCNMLCNDGNQSGKPGMPSSHSAITAFFVLYYFRESDSIIIKILLITILCMVGLSRYIKRCHTIYQIVAGYIYGGICAELTRNLIYEYHKI